MCCVDKHSSRPPKDQADSSRRRTPTRQKYDTMCLAVTFPVIRLGLALFYCYFFPPNEERFYNWLVHRAPNHSLPHSMYSKYLLRVIFTGSILNFFFSKLCACILFTSTCFSKPSPSEGDMFFLLLNVGCQHHLGGCHSQWSSKRLYHA